MLQNTQLPTPKIPSFDTLFPSTSIVIFAYVHYHIFSRQIIVPLWALFLGALPQQQALSFADFSSSLLLSLLYREIPKNLVFDLS